MKTAKFIIVVGSIAVWLVWFNDPSFSAQQTPPKKQELTCITSQCHATIANNKFVHGPVAVGQCAVCHGESPRHIENPKGNRFAPIKNISDNCFSCHERFKPKKFTHAAINAVSCTHCHNPHSSPYKSQLRASGSELCLSCHDKALVSGKFVHGPAAVGGCSACHEPHNSDFAKILKADGPKLCYSCHTDKSESITKSQFVHKPVAEKCTACHNPHSGPRQFMLSAAVPTLCLNCHNNIKGQLSTAAVKHRAVDMDKSCSNCHDPHNSNIAKNLIKPPMALCLSCHNREYSSGNNKIANLDKWLVENKDHHGPIKEKDCSGCHNPHGSANFRILRYAYPATFYQGFVIENYSLCFSCHEKTIALDRETTRLTNFRNGSDNLHFTHVNKDVKGRTCRACHETHASNFPKHIREAVPYGSWELPVNFKKTATGGSCLPGCHKLLKYDREKKERNE